MRFRLGRPKSAVDVEIDVCPVEQPSVDKYVWTYTSPVFPMTQVISTVGYSDLRMLSCVLILSFSISRGPHFGSLLFL